MLSEEVLSPGGACEHCGGKLKTLGEDVTEELEFVPGRVVILRESPPFSQFLLLFSAVLKKHPQLVGATLAFAPTATEGVVRRVDV